MFGSEILEVAIGLIFVFLISSLAVMSVREIIESVLKTRAVHLERGIRQLLDDPGGAMIARPVQPSPPLLAVRRRLRSANATDELQAAQCPGKGGIDKRAARHRRRQAPTRAAVKAVAWQTVSA